MLGRPEEDLVGAAAGSLLATPEDMGYWEAATEDATAGHVSGLRSETVLCGPDGRLLHAERSIQPLSAGPDQLPSHLLVTLRDRSADRGEVPGYHR